MNMDDLELIAGIDSGMRDIVASAWEYGMVAAKLAAAGVQPAKNPFVKEEA